MLHYIATHTNGSHVVTENTVRQFACTDYEKTVQLLLRRDLIEEVNGGYQFQIGLIHRWVAENSNYG